ncbi:DUF1614 domain-containing protein [Archaeoglobus sp.]
MGKVIQIEVPDWVDEKVIVEIRDAITILSMNLPTFILTKLAFSSGVLSALVGADILHLKDIEKIGSGIVSIGGAGTFDGIFLTGVFSVIFSHVI